MNCILGVSLGLELEAGFATVDFAIARSIRSASLPRTALVFRAGLEPVGGKQHAGFHQLFVEPPHFGLQVGIIPASESLLALIITMTRLVT